jgi:hypothetical protein
MNCPLFRSNMAGDTGGIGTAHSSVVPQRVIIVEEELPTLHSSELTLRLQLVEEERPTLQK